MWIGTVHAERTEHLPITLAETRSFASDVRKLMGEDEIAELKMCLAVNPQVGDIIRRTGGVRKVRWAIGNRGKSAGARIIYYYHCNNTPIFLLAAYAKNEKLDLTEAEKAMMKSLVKTLVREYS